MKFHHVGPVFVCLYSFAFAICARVHLGTSARVALIHFGHLDDGFMVLEKKGHPAFIYAASPQKDLALLKLISIPEDRILAPIELAENNSPPGSDCFTIGHPSRGLFWSLRSGEVVGVGKYPHDLIDNIMPLLALAGAEKEAFKESLRQSLPRKALISSCGINPGDSGGPLVNIDGELIAVNFAIPKIDKNRGVNLDKFSYHVHLKEVKEFLAERPESPEVFVPNIWPAAAVSRLMDFDGDHKLETWSFLRAKDGPLSGLLFDLDEDTPETFVEDFKAGKAKRSQFDFEFVLQFNPVRAFYDRDGDGQVDWILTDANDDRSSDMTIEKTEEGWKRLDQEGQSLYDPDYFQDQETGKRFQTIVLSRILKKNAAKDKDEAPPAAMP